MASRRRLVGWMALTGLGVTIAPPAAASCEDKGILDTLFPKNQDGNVAWDKAGRQVGDQLFWDQLAKATGAKVRACGGSWPTHCRGFACVGVRCLNDASLVCCFLFEYPEMGARWMHHNSVRTTSDC